MGNFSYLLEEINSTLIEGKTYNDVCHVITEELGVSDQVTQVAFDIMDKIMQDIQLIPKQYFSNVPGISYKDGDIEHSAFGKDITVKYRYINYLNQDYFDKYDSEIRQLPNSFNLETKTLRLTIKSISGHVDINTYADTIQHETEHYFQENKIGRSFSKSTWYKIATKCKEKPKNSLTYMIGDMIYITLKCEEEAFTNGLYAALVYNYRHENQPTSEIVDSSPAYNALLTFRKERETILNNRDDITLNKTLSTIKQTTGKNFNNLIAMFDKGEKELIRRIGRVIVKAQKDCKVSNDMWANDNRRNVYTKESVNDLYNLKNPLDSSPLLKI